MTTASLIHSVADFLWSEQQKITTRTADCDLYVAESLEAAETCADNLDIKSAIGYIEVATWQVYGVYSNEYANMARLFPHGAFRPAPGKLRLTS